MSRRSVHICRTAVVTCVKCSQNILTAVDVLELLKRHFPGRDPSSRRNLTLIRSISSTVTATSIVTAPAIKSLVGVKLDHFRVLWSHNPILNERIVGKVTLSQRRIVWAINDLGCAWVFEKKTFSKSHMHDKSPYRQEDIAGGSQPNVVLGVDRNDTVKDAKFCRLRFTGLTFGGMKVRGFPYESNTAHATLLALPFMTLWLRIRHNLLWVSVLSDVTTCHEKGLACRRDIIWVSIRDRPAADLRADLPLLLSINNELHSSSHAVLQKYSFIIILHTYRHLARYTTINLTVTYCMRPFAKTSSNCML